MTEAEFIGHIDCAFPYDDPPRARALIERAPAVSANAAFMVMHELARIPASVTVSPESRRDLLNHLRAHLNHPLAVLVSRLAEEMIAGRPVPVAEANTAMQAIAKHPGQYAALAIACFSCDDPEGIADVTYANVVRSWETA
jgi:hypothetical protein